MRTQEKAIEIINNLSCYYDKKVKKYVVTEINETETKRRALVMINEILKVIDKSLIKKKSTYKYWEKVKKKIKNYGNN